MRAEIETLLRPDLRGRSAYGAPQLAVPVALNTNENPYAVPPVVVEAMTAAVREHASDLNRYPDREFTALREALAGYLTRTAAPLSCEQVWAANGSNEILQHLLQAFGGPGRVALGFTPSYSMHPIIAATTGTAWVDGARGAGASAPFDLTAESVLAQVEQVAPDVIFLCSPNNPTGTALGLDVVTAVADAAPQSLVVVDEAYAEFARPGTVSALTALPARPHLVVTRTMSKAFALAGARVGYLGADPDLIDALRLVRLPYHLGTQTQAVALAALAHTDLMLAMVDAIIVQRDRIVRAATDLGFAPVASDANFVLIGGFADERASWEALLERGVLVRDVGLAHYLRVTAGTPSETDALLAALADLAPTHRQESS